jgi:hypothetical protein
VYNIRVKLTARGFLDLVLSFTVNAANEPLCLRDSINVIFILSCGHSVKKRDLLQYERNEGSKGSRGIAVHRFSSPDDPLQVLLQEIGLFQSGEHVSIVAADPTPCAPNSTPHLNRAPGQEARISAPPPRLECARPPGATAHDRVRARECPDTNLLTDAAAPEDGRTPVALARSAGSGVLRLELLGPSEQFQHVLRGQVGLCGAHYPSPAFLPPRKESQAHNKVSFPDSTGGRSCWVG